MTTINPNNEIKNKAILMIAILICLLLIGVAFGCKSKSTPTQTKTIEKDSIYTSVNYIRRDTTIVIPGDSITLRVPVYTLNEDPIFLSSGGMSISLSKINEDILAKCNSDDLRKIIELQDKIIKEHKSKIEIKEVEKPIKYVPKFTEIMSYIGIAACVAFLIFGIIKLKRFFEI